jgi:hypothetical protein
MSSLSSLFQMEQINRSNNKVDLFIHVCACVAVYVGDQCENMYGVWLYMYIIQAHAHSKILVQVKNTHLVSFSI